MTSAMLSLPQEFCTRWQACWEKTILPLQEPGGNGWGLRITLRVSVGDFTVSWDLTPIPGAAPVFITENRPGKHLPFCRCTISRTERHGCRRICGAAAR